MALPYVAEFFPLGFPVVVASNSAVVLDAAGESWSGFARRFEERAIEIRCIVSEWEASTGDFALPAPVVRAQGNLLVSVADPENFYCCDLVNGFGSAWVSDRAASNASYFRYHFIEAMAYGLLDTLHLVAVHAACVSLDGRGVLLAGNSGAGKSSLAYACARRGWVYTSDDCSSLVLRDSRRKVLGNPGLFRFRETAGALFPEFRGLGGFCRGNGKPTIEVKAASLPGIQTALESHVDRIVFLNRHGGEGTMLIPVPEREARERLFFDPWPRELPVHAERIRAMERLLAAPACEMRYRDLDQAVDLLEDLVHGGCE